MKGGVARKGGGRVQQPPKGSLPRVRAVGMPFRTSDTIIFFWSGLQRQQMVLRHALDTTSRSSMAVLSLNTTSAQGADTGIQ